MKTIQKKISPILVALLCVVGILFISQTPDRGSGVVSTVVLDTPSCVSPTYLPGLGGKPISPVSCGQNIILCKDFISNFVGVPRPSGLSNGVGTASRGTTVQDKFVGNVSCLNTEWMKRNFLGPTPKDFRIYFGKKSATEHGVVMVPVNASCGENANEAKWIPATSTESSTCPAPGSVDKCTMNNYVNAYQTEMDKSAGKGKYIKSWTYDANVLAKLTKIKKKDGSSIEATKFLLEYGVVKSGNKGATFDELDPIFHVEYPLGGGGKYFSEYADWAQPCPVLCPGERLFGNGLPCPR